VSTPIDDGGQAFPTHGNGMFGEPVTLRSGMTLRDWFAGKEQCPTAEEIGLSCAEALAGKHPTGEPDTNPIEWMQWDCEWCAKLRYMRADAMLKARGCAS